MPPSSELRTTTGTGCTILTMTTWPGFRQSAREGSPRQLTQWTSTRIWGTCTPLTRKKCGTCCPDFRRVRKCTFLGILNANKLLTHGTDRETAADAKRGRSDSSASGMTSPALSNSPKVRRRSKKKAKTIPQSDSSSDKSSDGVPLSKGKQPANNPDADAPPTRAGSSEGSGGGPRRGGPPRRPARPGFVNRLPV